MSYLETTREQHNALERLCLEHGTCEVMRLQQRPGGTVMYVSCEDGTRWSIYEDGAVR